MSDSSKVLKSGIWYTVSNFLVKGIGFITTPIFTRLLTQEQYGDYSNYSSWLSIFTIIVSLNLESTVLSAKYDYKDKLDNYILSVLSMGALSVACWTLVLNVFHNMAVNFLSMDMIYINCMMVYIFFHMAVNIFQVRERYMYRYKVTVATSVAISIGGSLLSVILVVFMSNKLTGRIVGLVIPTAAIGAAMYVYFIVKGKRIDFHCWKYALVICLPYIPHLLSMTLLNSMDRVMIKRFCGSEDVALYSLAYTCGSLVTLLISSMNGAYAPWLGDRIYHKEYKPVRDFSIKYILLFVYFSLAIMLLTPEVLLILGGEQYYEAIYVMPPVTMGCICQFIYTMFVNVEQFSKKTVGMAIGSVTAALQNYVLNLLLIPRFGYIAAAYTTLVGFLWLLIVHMILVYRLKLNQLYNYKFILFLVVVLCVFTIFVNFLYAHTVMRYAFILCYVAMGGMVVYRFRNEFKELLGKLKG